MSDVIDPSPDFEAQFGGPTFINRHECDARYRMYKMEHEKVHSATLLDITQLNLDINHSFATRMNMLTLSLFDKWNLQRLANRGKS